MNVLDLFAGAGGWSVACRELGLDEAGVEIDKSARATRTAAGFVNHDCNDALDIDPLLFSQNALGGVIASPPCQDWSKAGKQRGRLGPTGSLVDTTFEIVRCLLPRWVAFEQVPRVLPEWEAFAEELRRMSYSTWTGVLSAEEYGVPQLRKRAILIASRSSALGRPPRRIRGSTRVTSPTSTRCSRELGRSTRRSGGSTRCGTGRRPRSSASFARTCSRSPATTSATRATSSRANTRERR